MINRWVEEDGLLATLDELGIGSIVFSPLAQGMLTSKYLGGIPEGARVIVAGQNFVGDGAKVNPVEADAATIQRLVEEATAGAI